MKLTKEEFWSKSRFFYEIADYLSVSPRTLKAWIDKDVNVKLVPHKKLYSPKEVKTIIEYFGV